MSLINQVSGTPYISGGNSPAGTDCSGLASWVANAATGRDPYSGRFHTANEESALLARGFRPGTAPNALVIGWNSGHTAVTLPDGTPVSSGEGGGVKVGGGGAYQKQFTRHMYLPIELASGLAPQGDPAMIDVANTELPPPPNPFAPPPPAPDPFAPPPAEPVAAELPPPPDPFAPPPPALDPFAPPPAEPAVAELPPPADAPAPFGI